jgi:hypothetical protein
MKKIAKNGPRYFTGKPCKNGHIAERYSGNRECVECGKARVMRPENRPTPEYTLWVNMKCRCLPNHADSHRYFARAIFVIGRWHSFKNFIADMGLRPSPAHSIDRINNDLGYFPGNCRWATKTQQANNRNYLPRHLWRGKHMTSREIWELEKPPFEARFFIKRLKAGMEVSRALTLPYQERYAR